MMGLEEPTQNKLFYTDFQLESRIRQNHPLRKIAKVIDFSFAYKAVSECYGKNGNVSVPPPVILKLMLLLVFYNVHSERDYKTHRAVEERSEVITAVEVTAGDINERNETG